MTLIFDLEHTFWTRKLLLTWKLQARVWCDFTWSCICRQPLRQLRLTSDDHLSSFQLFYSRLQASHTFTHVTPTKFYVRQRARYIHFSLVIFTTLKGCNTCDKNSCIL